MRPRERVLAALNHREPDRVPMNYHADGNMSKTLKKHFGLEGDQSRKSWITGNEDPRLLEALDCDLRVLVPDYIGPPVQVFEDGSFITPFGERLLIRENERGAAYFHYLTQPLASATTLEEINAHPWPRVEHYDFACIRDQLEQWEDYAIVAGDMGVLDCVNRCLTLFGYERVMIGMAERDPVLLRAFQRIHDFYYEYMKRMFEVGGRRIDIAYYGEDLGTQIGPRFSVAMYRQLIQPLWTRHLEMAKQHDCITMQHSCGSVRAFYPELIRMGIQVHDAVQVYTAGMDPVGLKRDFGDRLSFHGAISIQHVLENGSKADVEAEVRRIIDALAPGGGYILAPTHWIQSGTPIENVLTMYDTAKEYSAYFYRKRR